MSNNFLRSYTIPTINTNFAASAAVEDVIDQSNGNGSPFGTATDSSIEQAHYVNSSQKANNQTYQNPSRFVPPGKQGSDYVFQKRAPKRKLGPAVARIIKPPLFMGRDESYPDELNELFKPLFCELCNAQLNSSKTANIHYQSKVHDKNINIWLARNFKEKGLEPPTIKRFYAGGVGPVGPDAYHCEICDLNLTSKLHAEQHYSGRKHQLVLSKTSKPSGSGYYDAGGKWVRTGTKATPPPSKDGRFGIGEQFKPETPIAEGINKKTSNEENEQLDSLVKEPIIEKPQNELFLTCKLCNVSVTSAVQLNLHLEGIKHRKKVKASGEQFADVDTAEFADTVLVSLNNVAADLGDLSMFRTPSGSYYCKTCDISMTHQSALLQHLQGKKHIKKAASDTSAQASAK